MPVTHQHGIDLTNRTSQGPLFWTLKYYGLQQLNYFKHNKLFLFIKKNNWALNDYIIWMFNNPNKNGTFYDKGDNVHIQVDDFRESRDVFFSFFIG